MTTIHFTDGDQIEVDQYSGAALAHRIDEGFDDTAMASVTLTDHTTRVVTLASVASIEQESK